MRPARLAPLETGVFRNGTAPALLLPAVSPSVPRRGEVVRIRDERWTVAGTVAYRDATALTVVGCDRSNRGTRARYLLPFEPFERLPSIAAMRAVSQKRWRHLAREVLAQAPPLPDRLVAAASADITILPYQLEPALAVVGGAASRILIADEVGLGKTVQAGLIVAETLARRRGDGHVLVLCPAGLRDQWQEELTRRFRIAPVVLDSSALRRAAPGHGANPWAAHPLVVTSTDYIKRPEVVRALESIIWDLLVIDEAHGIAGVSDRHDAAHLLAQRARIAVMLTATPHSGSDIGFERLRSIGDIDNRFPLLAFRRTRTQSGDRPGRRTRWLRVRLSDTERQMHRTLMAYVRRVWRQPASTAARLAMIILTRRACSSASSLARTLERRIALLGPGVEGVQLGLPLDPLGASDDEPSEVGAPGLDDSGDERRALDAILAIARRVTAESKLRWLVRFLERTNEAAIVFTEYRDTLMVLERELARFGTCQLHGGLTAAERAAAIQTFTRGDSRMLLATDAASEGLNLQQRCRLVIHLEVPWTPTRIEQRVGRVDRIGQHRIVHEAHVVAAGTVEESRVMRVVQRMAEVALAHESLSLSPVQEQEIAACAIGSEALPPRDGFRPLPAGVVTADFRRQAMAEAARVLTARRLLTAICPSASPPPARPFVAQARRARSGSALWALWLELVDSDGQLLWETLIGVSGPHRWKPPACSRDIRLLADKGWSHVRVATLEHRGFGVADAVFASFGVATAIALDRERAIARAIEHGRARIAAHLIQQGLFDRRAERDAVAQRELAAQTLRRCQARIDELTRRAAADIAVRPAFSLIAW